MVKANAGEEEQIAATDKKIDQLAYELYGLTEDEIRVVEGGLRCYADGCRSLRAS